MKLSCLILTYNEEINIERCLQSLDWCDDIAVIDSGSTDRTVEIARRYGARILQRKFDNFAGQRNYGLEHGEFIHQWVLHLDADEVVTAELRDTLAALEPVDGIDGYFLPSKTMLFDQWLKHAGMYPTYQARLGHRDWMWFIQVGHGQREDLPASRMGQIEVPYLHYSFSHGMRRWLEKHVQYAEDEAGLILEMRSETGGADIKDGEGSVDGTPAERRRAKARAAKIPLALRPLARFAYVYFIRQGFRDGRAGFAYAFMLAIYEGMTAIIALERTRNR